MVQKGLKVLSGARGGDDGAFGDAEVEGSGKDRGGEGPTARREERYKVRICVN